MPKLTANKGFSRCFNEALSEMKCGKNPFEGLTDEIAVSAAAQLVETAALNLASVLPSDDIVDLMFISQQLEEFVAYIATLDDRSVNNSTMLN